MKQLFIFLLVVTGGQICFAQQAKVIKVKGQQAIVQFPAGVKPQVGQLINVGTDADEDEPEATVSTAVGGSNRRQYIVGGSASLGYINNSQTSKSSLELSMISVRAGWNLVQYEAGPIGTFSYASSEGSSSRVLEVGGYFDYNLIPNKPGTELVYGAGVEGTFGQEAVKAGNSEASNVLMGLFAGGFVKWFGLKNATAVRIDAGLDYDRTAQTSTTVTRTGLVTKAGLSVYF